MRRKPLYALILASALLITSCASSESSKAEPTLFISLAGNPTTGYIWDYTAEGSGKIELEDESIERDSSLLGAPSVFRYSFRGVKEGSLTLIFEYARPWQSGDVQDTKTYRLLVNKDLSITEL